METPQSWTYNAFLSYSHSEHARLAGDVQRVLHSIARPWYRLRAVRVFRDKSSIAPTESLWNSIVEALQSAEFFLLLASPGAAESPWVAKEVEWWLKHRGTHNFILVIGGGTVAWEMARGDFNPALSTAVPPTLFGRFADEPLWVDVSFAATNTERKIRDRLSTELLPVAARLHHKAPDVLGGEDLRRRRTAYLLASGLGLLTVAGLGLGLFAARESNLKAQVAQREAQEQTARAEKERLDRIAGLTAQSTASAGVSALAVAQLAHAAQASAGPDAQRHRFVLSFWLHYLVPSQDLMAKMSTANWGSESYAMSDGKFVALEGGRKTLLALSPKAPVAYAADAGRGQFSIHRLSDGKALARTDISDLTVASGGIGLYELAGGRCLLLHGETQSASAGGREPRLLFTAADGSGSVWLKPNQVHSVRASADCQQFQAIENADELAEDSASVLATVTVQPDGSVRVVRRALPDDAPELAAPKVGLGRTFVALERACKRLQLAFDGRELPFPSKYAESALWKDTGHRKLQSLDPRALSVGSLPDGSRGLTPEERAAATARMRSELPKLRPLRDTRLKSAATTVSRPSEPGLGEPVISVGMELIVEDLQVDDALRAIDAPGGLVLWTSHAAGAQYGEHTLCKLPKERGEVQCAILHFHGDFGAHTISNDGRYFLAADRTYEGHESFGLFDLETMQVVPIGIYPFGTIIAAEFDAQRSLLAALSGTGELYVYRLKPTVELISRSSLDLPQAPEPESWGDRRASCFRFFDERVIYCNVNGGLTAVSVSGAETLWTTPRLFPPDEDASILWHAGSSIAVLRALAGLRLFRPDDGVMLSDWVTSVASPKSATIQDVALGSDDTVYAKVNQRWYRRLSPLTTEQVQAALTEIPCLTGFEPGASVKRAEALRCATGK